MYCSIITSSFKKDEYACKVREGLLEIKDDVDSLVYWDEKNCEETNFLNAKDIKEDCNKDYIELQRLINKILG